MRPQAKPFAVQIRKSRRPSSEAPLIVTAEEGRSTRFDEAERLFQPTPPSAAKDKATEAARSRKILPDLSVPTAPSVPAEKARLPRGTALRPKEGAAAGLSSPARPQARRPASMDEDTAPAALARPERAPRRKGPSPAGSAGPVAAPKAQGSPSSDAPAPRRRGQRAQRAEFLPGQRWKRRLAPILR